MHFGKATRAARLVGTNDAQELLELYIGFDGGNRDRSGRRYAGPAVDSQPVQQYGPRSSERRDPSQRRVSAGGFRQRLQEPGSRARHPAADGGRVSYGGYETGALGLPGW